MLTEYIICKQLIEWLKYNCWRYNYDFIMKHKKGERVVVREDNPMDLSTTFLLCDCADNVYYNIRYSNKQIIELSPFSFYL